MKIMFLIRSLEYGGTENQLVLLAKELHQQGHQIWVTLLSPGNYFEKDLIAAEVPLLFINPLKHKNKWLFPIRLIQIVRQEQPEVLYGFLPFGTLLVTGLKVLFPRIQMVWGIRCTYSKLNDWSDRFGDWAQSKLSRFIDLIITNSYSGFDSAISRGYCPQKLTVIPNGIDTDKFCPNIKKRRKIREELQIHDNETLIGLVGRWHFVKDHISFLKAAALMKQKYNFTKFVFVGAGNENYRQKLMKLSEELELKEDLFWLERRSDMPDIYNALDILTLPSTFGEGFPNVIGEAMSCGVPCIVTNINDSPKIVGNLGIVIPSKDPQAMYQGWKTISEKLKDNRVDIQKQNRQRIIENFSKERLITDTQKALKNLL